MRKALRHWLTKVRKNSDFLASSDKATPTDLKALFLLKVFSRPWPAAGQARRDDALYPLVVFESGRFVKSGYQKLFFLFGSGSSGWCFTPHVLRFNFSWRTNHHVKPKPRKTVSG
jgi:hypothetical protein